MSVENRLNTISPIAVSRDEFLTPFDNIFDQYFKVHFPMLSKEFGEDFFNKGSYPKVDIINEDSMVTIEAEVPGVTKEDINLRVENNNTLVISGGKQKKVDTNNNNNKKHYIVKELKKSSFQRSFQLGDNFDKDSILAEFKDGILTVKINKIKPVVPPIKNINIL